MLASCESPSTSRPHHRSITMQMKAHKYNPRCITCNIFSLTMFSLWLVAFLDSVHSFTSSSLPLIRNQRQVIQPIILHPSTSHNRSRNSILLAAPPAVIPTLDGWEPSEKGGVRGTVTNHPDPNILDGDYITTSPLKTREELQMGLIVTTASGSQYRLGTSAAKSFLGLKKKAVNSNNYVQVFEDYGLTGMTIGNGKYLLGSTPRKSTSGKSTLWPAYKNMNPNMVTSLQSSSSSSSSRSPSSQELGKKIQPTGNLLCVKISPYYDILLREEENYNRITKKPLFRGRFVDKIDFLPSIDNYDISSPLGIRSRKMSLPELESDLCGLILEAGWIDVKTYLRRNSKPASGFSPLSFFSLIRNKNTDGQGLPKRALRDAAAAAAECIQALHISGLVWTDCKTENFVLVKQDEKEEMGQVKGIDLESAVKCKSPPTDFSPEACPPEFAAAFVSGKALTFQVDYNYDIWSFGMLLYEMATGRCYYGKKTPTQMTQFLAQLSREDKKKKDWMDLSLIQDGNLKDLIAQCTLLDPVKRPNITQILLHPYFLTSGVGPFGF